MEIERIIGRGLDNLSYMKMRRRELRNNMTPAERKLWSVIRKKQLDGRKFRRQQSIGSYVLDFYCFSERLAIELDGQYHFSSDQTEYDRNRDEFLKAYGIKILRFENKYVFEHLDWLLNEIRQEFSLKPNP